MRIFFDTNVLVYLFDKHAPAKQQRARALLAEHSADGSFVLSMQVLQEFYVAVTRKLSEPLSPAEATEALRLFSTFALAPIDASLVIAAAERTQRDMVSFWDSLILEAALAGGAVRLLSEDMHDGREVSGLRIENPFRDLG